MTFLLSLLLMISETAWAGPKYFPGSGLDLAKEPYASQLCGAPVRAFENGFVDVHEIDNGSAKLTGTLAPGGGPPGVAACYGTLTYRRHETRWKDQESGHVMLGDSSDQYVVRSLGTVPDHGVPRPIALMQHVHGRVNMTTLNGKPADEYVVSLKKGEGIAVEFSNDPYVYPGNPRYRDIENIDFLFLYKEKPVPRDRRYHDSNFFIPAESGDYTLRAIASTGKTYPYQILVKRYWPGDLNRH